MPFFSQTKATATEKECFQLPTEVLFGGRESSGRGSRIWNWAVLGKKRHLTGNMLEVRGSYGYFISFFTLKIACTKYPVKQEKIIIKSGTIFRHKNICLLCQRYTSRIRRRLRKRFHYTEVSWHAAWFRRPRPLEDFGHISLQQLAHQADWLGTWKFRLLA